MQLRGSIQWCLLALVTVPALGQSQVLWERYAGDRYNPMVTGRVLDVPFYANMGSAPIADLLALASDPLNAVDQGSSDQLNWTEEDDQLCNYTNPDSASCELAALGQVSYAILRFPEAGTYQLLVQHDDQVRLDSSTDLGSPAYRNASYTLASERSGWSETALQLTTHTTTADNSCLLVRLAWNNTNTRNELILSWTGPGIDAPEVIPASNILDPRSQPASCNEQPAVTPVVATPVPSTGFYALTLLSALLAATVFIRRKRVQ